MNKTQLLRAIILDLLHQDVMKKSQKREMVDARKIYANILFSKGFGKTFIARSILKNHATILHYLNDTEVLLLMDASFKEKYENISNAFERRLADSSMNLMNRTELENELERLREENHELKLMCLKKINKSK